MEGGCWCSIHLVILSRSSVMQHSLCLWQFWLEQLISQSAPHSEIEEVYQVTTVDVM